MLPWWLVIGYEQPGPVYGCSDPGCAVAEIAPTDLYCRTHGHFLPAATWPLGRARFVVANAARIAVCAGFLLTALLDSPIPAWVVGLAVATVAIAAPLRVYPATRAFAASCWTLVALAAATQTRNLEGFLTALGVALPTVWFLYSAALSWGVDHWRPRIAAADRGAGYVAASLSFALPALVVSLQGFPALRIAAAVGLVGAAAGAVTVGIVSGGMRIDTVVSAQLPYPPRPPRLNWTLPPKQPAATAAGPFDRLGLALSRFAHGSLRVSAIAARTAADGTRLFLHLLAIVVIGLVNWLVRVVVRTWRRMVRTLTTACRTLWWALWITAAATVRSFRVLVLPVALFAAAGIAVLRWADHVHRYLIDGAIADLAGLGATAAIALLALTAAWMLLSANPLVGSVRSATHSAENAGANGVVLTTVGGWTIGLPGLLGFGPIRVGWLTIGATVLLVAAFLSLLARRRRSP
ncbi:hypothetical protein [Glycomyces xiaoerkulensis]|uniref:hypothetical protein n=1 Tax=Glycomyces xiaoerkulensis TaxID=2038139 RepID=UPI0018E3FF70|nr:hypothetical protein [Glycomyces xiaoerkulensis]